MEVHLSSIGEGAGGGDGVGDGVGVGVTTAVGAGVGVTVGDSVGVGVTVGVGVGSVAADAGGRGDMPTRMMPAAAMVAHQALADRRFFDSKEVTPRGEYSVLTMSEPVPITHPRATLDLSLSPMTRLVIRFFGEEFSPARSVT